jgi:hypothetical protein
MTHLGSFRITIYLILTIALFSCKSDQADADILTPEEDTRLWVQEAYRKIDLMKLNPTFNLERAQLIRARLEKAANLEEKINIGLEYALEVLKSGDTEDALQLYSQLTRLMDEQKVEMDDETRRNIMSVIAIAFMRHGEIQNCVENHNHESCFLPIQGGGIHKLPYGSENAIVQYEKILKDFPDDLESKYLLNIAYMTLGKYPDGVPAAYRIAPSWFASKVDFPKFKDVAPELGLNRNGLAGGTIIDDFTNDGWLDIVITSWKPTEELIFYVNNGDGTFSDQTVAYGLKGHVGVLNLNQTDFNNDGWLDIYLMRGGWYQTQGDIPNTLLMNTGKGSFRDVTLKAGLTHVAPTQTSAWSDFNLDGWLDLVVCNESLPGFDRGIDFYINQQNGTFTHESSAYGLTLNKYYKGCVATDINNDRYPDIYMSSLAAPNDLFLNQGATGKKGFTNIAAQAGVDNPVMSFPCWNFDYDNDGNEDLFVSGYTNDGTPAKNWMLSKMGKGDPEMLPKLYHNNGHLKFEEVGLQMGLNEIAFTMGCSFGDINSDGFLDFYLSTGNPIYQSLVPNKMYLNIAGKRFEDVSYSGGFANIQKGHGVAFGDLDRDGDEDIYVVIGGAFDGDDFYNCLFENPNQDQNNWLVLNLTGTTANKVAIGARVTVSVEENGKERIICRTVTSGTSFGANSLALEIGLQKSTVINHVKIQWPCKDCPDQLFTGIEMNKAYHITQGEEKSKAYLYTYAPFATKGEASKHHHH